MSSSNLSKAVQDRLSEQTPNSPLFSQAALDALMLADVYSSVTAPEYVLPLDAMAGFTRQSIDQK